MQSLASLPIAWQTVLLLTLSNVFMTFAWYGHLKFKSAPLIVVILASWASPSSNTSFGCRRTGSDMGISRRPS